GGADDVEARGDCPRSPTSRADDAEANGVRLGPPRRIVLKIATLVPPRDGELLSVFSTTVWQWIRTLPALPFDVGDVGGTHVDERASCNPGLLLGARSECLAVPPRVRDRS